MSLAASEWDEGPLLVYDPDGNLKLVIEEDTTDPGNRDKPQEGPKQAQSNP